jgi:hypothetical protein
MPRSRCARLASSLLSMVALTLGLLVTSSTVGPVPPAAAAPPTIQVSSTTVALNDALVVSGRATRGRSVTLQLLRAGQWETVGVTQATSGGTFSVAAPTWWLGYRQVRVWTPSALLSRGGYSPVAGYHVVPRYVPAGSAAHHRLELPGYRWNPCRVIGWKFNPNGGDTRLLHDVNQAIATVSAATGLRFAYQGTTTYVGSRHTAARAGTQILVSWATPRQVARLRGRRVGVAMTSVEVSRRQYVGSSIALDRTHRLRHGSRARGRPTWAQVVLHELAHAIGLGHTTARRQLLYAKVHRRNHRLGAGDLAGLQRLGADRPCL